MTVAGSGAEGEEMVEVRVCVCGGGGGGGGHPPTKNMLRESPDLKSSQIAFV